MRRLILFIGYIPRLLKSSSDFAEKAEMQIWTSVTRFFARCLRAFFLYFFRLFARYQRGLPRARMTASIIMFPSIGIYNRKSRAPIVDCLG